MSNVKIQGYERSEHPSSIYFEEIRKLNAKPIFVQNWMNAGHVLRKKGINSHFGSKKRSVTPLSYPDTMKIQKFIGFTNFCETM